MVVVSGSLSVEVWKFDERGEIKSDPSVGEILPGWIENYSETQASLFEDFTQQLDHSLSLLKL